MSTTTQTAAGIAARALDETGAPPARADFEALFDRPSYSGDEVADLLGVAPSTVRYWRHVGRGPKAWRLPGTRRNRYLRADLIAWAMSAYVDTASA